MQRLIIKKHVYNYKTRIRAILLPARLDSFESLQVTGSGDGFVPGRASRLELSNKCSEIETYISQQCF